MRSLVAQILHHAICDAAAAWRDAGRLDPLLLNNFAQIPVAQQHGDEAVSTFKELPEVLMLRQQYSTALAIQSINSKVPSNCGYKCRRSVFAYRHGPQL